MYKRIIYLSFVICGFFYSCKKEVINFPIDHSPPTSGTYLLFDADQAFNTGQIAVPSPYTSIYYSNINGSNITKITPTDGNYYNYRASWSPDGKQIIYTRGDQLDVDRSVSIIDITGRNLKNVVKGDEADYGSFSPDGSKIVYAKSLVHVIPYNYDVYIANTDGTSEQRLTTFANDSGGISDIHWASNGKIYFSAGSTHTRIGIYSINPDGSNLTFILSDVSFLTVSPDAKHILFDLGDGLYVCNTDGTNIKTLITYDNSNPNALIGACYTSGGEQIFLSNADYPTNLGIYSLNNDGSNIQRILYGYYEYPSVF